MNNPRSAAILYFLGAYKHLFSALLLVTILTAVLEGLSIAAFFPLFSSVLSDTRPEAGGILGLVDGLAGLVPFSSPLVAASVLLIGMFLAKLIFNFISSLLTAYVNNKVLYESKKLMMDKYATAHYQYFLDNQQGVLIYNVISAPSAVSGVLAMGTRLVMGLFKVIAMGTVLMSIMPMAALAAAVLGVVYYLFIHYISKKISYFLGQKLAEFSGEQTVVANEFFTGFRQIITFNVADLWTNRFDRASRAYRDIGMRTAVWNAFPRPIMEFSAVAFMLGIILIMKITSPGSFTQDLPRLGVFALALIQLMPVLSMIGTTRMGLMSSLPNMERAHQTLNGAVPQRKEGFITLKSFERAIAFDDVTFAYQGREPVLKGVSLTLEKGKVTAIVGASGAGKTTIVNLVLGLFEPSQGRVTVDGIPIQQLKQETWLSKIGSVSQDTFTFHSSINENILLGRNNHSQTSIVDAAMVANANEFISQHPEGYEAVIGDRGMRLSGGQQQRLAIARAVLDTPEIFIFDEATSSLDNISEKQVQEAINSVSADRTVIIVAHRLSTIRHADKIIVMDNCQVVEEGTHLELLSQNGHYATMAGAIG